jgi:hypothetical protein
MFAAHEIIRCFLMTASQCSAGTKNCQVHVFSKFTNLPISPLVWWDQAIVFLRRTQVWKRRRSAGVAWPGGIWRTCAARPPVAIHGMPAIPGSMCRSAPPPPSQQPSRDAPLHVGLPAGRTTSRPTTAPPRDRRGGPILARASAARDRAVTQGAVRTAVVSRAARRTEDQVRGAARARERARAV